MAITSEIIGKLGGGEVDIVEVNKPINNSDGFQDLHTITVDKPSLVAATLTHDNTNSFSGTSGRAAMAITGAAEGPYYAASYGVGGAAGKPLSIAVTLDAGTFRIQAVSTNRSADYTAQTLTVAIIKM
ncbi:hypothetical protein [Corynebacterium stationis]|uniref:Uncharacterized protein n=1 Tax=Corynebacterium stationis TaxID=1705 RepID=A0AB36CLM4_9CORY|nr:hypothetical protein [Corynebacterium stationis]NME89547.1 hypothetical protein [Corynebacterium stationis]